MNHSQRAALRWNPAQRQLQLSGDWTHAGIAELERSLPRQAPPTGDWVLDDSGVTAMDTAGAYLLARLLQRLARGGAVIDSDGLSDTRRQLLRLIAGPPGEPAPPPPGLLERLGRDSVGLLARGYTLLAFLGEITAHVASRLIRPTGVRWKQVASEVQKAGVSASPIVGLLAFLMGVVIAYQGGAQLALYGAGVFLVELVTLTMLREMAPLIAAIVAAGRTGSAYAAQIGTMRLTQEVDALRTVGIAPFDMLVLPKLIGLMVALPLLTAFADVCGVFGGMLVADGMFGVDMTVFIDRAPAQLAASNLWTGLAKAPVFAALITLVSCYQGFQVRGGAEAVGHATTTAVVQSIFLVITADAAFSVVFQRLGV